MKKNRIAAILIIILGSITFWFVLNNKNSTIKKELSDFAFEDTASITKIFLVDNEKKSILLERVNATQWTLNKKYKAREDAVNVLLTTIKRVAVKTPVPKPAFENVVKQIAVKHVKIEIYQSNDEPVKVYYVGHNNQEHSGTYMLLENSSVPFLMHIEGFRGFLSARYFTNENEWRSTAIFNYNYGEIAEIKLEYPSQPEKSFSITDFGNNKFSLKELKANTEILNYDTAALMQYAALFQKIHFEGFEETRTQAFKDSIIKTTPMQIFTVTDKTGNSKIVKTFIKPAKEGSTDMDGKPIFSDLDRFYGWIDNTNFVVLQYFVFDPLLKSSADFHKKN